MGRIRVKSVKFSLANFHTSVNLASKNYELWDASASDLVYTFFFSLIYISLEVGRNERERERRKKKREKEREYRKSSMKERPYISTFFRESLRVLAISRYLSHMYIHCQSPEISSKCSVLCKSHSLEARGGGGGGGGGKRKTDKKKEIYCLFFFLFIFFCKLKVLFKVIDRYINR